MTERHGLKFLTIWGLIFLIFTLLTLFRKIVASYRNQSISYTANHMTSFYVMATFTFNPLTMFPTYRSQSGDLLCKSTDWFLYDENRGRYIGLTVWPICTLCFINFSKRLCDADLNIEWNLFKVNNKDTRTTPLTWFSCLYC